MIQIGVDALLGCFANGGLASCKLRFRGILRVIAYAEAGDDRRTAEHGATQVALADPIQRCLRAR